MKIAYGAICSWWDSIDKTGRTPEKNGISLPACPHCKRVLFETDEASWWKSVDQHEEAGNPGYRKFIEWARGKCFPSYSAARDAYTKEQAQ